MKRFLARIVPALAALALLAGCDAAPSRYEASFMDVFDTVTKVIIYADSAEEAQARTDELHAILTRYHRLFDIYNDYEGVNSIKTVNDNAGVAPVAVDPETIALIQFAKEAYTLTGGRVNVAMGSVLSIWHEYREAGIEDPGSAALPPMEELRAAAEHTDIDDVVVDAEAGTVYLADPEMSLDVGAVAKGFAAERAADSMREAGVGSMLLSLGGNIRSIGSRADGKSWEVGVQNPEGDGMLLTLYADDVSLVTSGAYQRYYTVDSRRYHHIIDPETLMPAQYFLSVSVFTEDSALADALSTALFIMDLDDGRALVDSLEGVEAMWVDTEGAISETEGFASRVTK